MVFRSSPRRRLVVQAEIKPGRPKRQAPKAYGVWSRSLGGQGERRAAICRDAREKNEGARRRGARGKGAIARAGALRASSSRRSVSAEGAIQKQRGKGKERGRKPPAPRILGGGALLQQSSRAHSPIPWFLPLFLQSICNSASSSSPPTNLGGLSS